jgi:hypothetical protein
MPLGNFLAPAAILRHPAGFSVTRAADGQNREISDSLVINFLTGRAWRAGGFGAEEV